MTSSFQLVTEFSPKGDQPQAIEALADAFQHPHAREILLGVTGSGKTFTAANLIQKLQVPTLVLAPNKTLASQLYGEFLELFPNNAVEYFVSYYDYFQPEAYIPSSDTYIEKDARINERIDLLRNAATAALLSRRDVIVVASVSCIYGLGDPETYQGLALKLVEGSSVKREELVRGLVRTQHTRAEVEIRPGSFRLRGPAVEIWPIHEQERVLRVELDGDRIDALLYVDPLTGEIVGEPASVAVYPVGHYVQPEDKIPEGIVTIRAEMDKHLRSMRKAGKEIEAERLERRTLSDLEDLEELGHCGGIENYSRHFEGRATGQPPFTLINYFPKDFLCILDESHVTLPQVYAMSKGDFARKQNLVDYGFRLPSAIDNRPLQEMEFESLLSRVLYVSATPGDRERRLASGNPVEQIVRPTGLLDPTCEIRPAVGQVENALASILPVVEKGDRVLVTTLTKRSAEDLTEFLQENHVRARYLHSDIDTLERSELLRDLRLGVYDVLVGINLLREGLDLPEVSLVLVLDADREGFLRSTTSLIQTCGRAARNVDGHVVFYADKMTKSLTATLEEGDRRRAIQHAYNLEHGIIPQTIRKKVRGSLATLLSGDEKSESMVDSIDPATIEKRLRELQREMLQAASALDFETALALRDEVRRLEMARLEIGK
ncbi:MAG: excinuclease ABC subunit UvrB [Planctomycetota bacterium]|nr:excinuclease ABC subunit UvrB [Planctomycetota bacterium]MDA1112922.1 excinuclease ABC subunit UvrB [Planctomycetota bacterium]